MKIKKGDNVIVRSGKSRGFKGKVARVLPTQNRVIVEGANLAKRRSKPRKQGEKGQTVEKPMPLAVGAIALWCDKCGRGVRVGVKLNGKVKTRVCRRCGSTI